MSIRMRVRKGAAVLLGAALLASCSGADSTTSEDVEDSVPASDEIGEPEEEQVVVQGATAAPNLGYLPLYVAQSGAFEEEGITVEIQYSHGDAAPLQAIDTGQAQVMSGTPEALLHGYENGLRGTLFYQTYDEVIFSVGVPDGGEFTDPVDLEGADIGVSSMASTGVVIAELLVEEAGGDPDSLNFVPVGVGQQALGAMEAGQVDALAQWDTAYAQLETSGLELEYWKPEATEGIPGGGYFTSWELIEEQPNTLARFTRAIAKAMVEIDQNKEDALEIYWEINPSGKPSDNDDEAMELGLAQLEVIGRSLDWSSEPAEIDTEALSRYGELFVQHGDVDEAPSGDDIATNVFLENAQDAAAEARGE